MQEHRLQAASDRTADVTRRWILTPEADGGFRLCGEGTGSWTARPAPGGWSVEESAAPGQALSLGRADGGPWRTTLSGPAGPGGAERGKTLPGGDLGRGVVLMADGRCYRITLEGPRDPRFELRSGCLVGIYLVARPVNEAEWTIEAGPAGCELPDLEAVLLLFSAELLADGAAARDGSEPNDR